jgi:hypothetical protein
MVGWIGSSDAVWKNGDGSEIAGLPFVVVSPVFNFVDMVYGKIYGQ